MQERQNYPFIIIKIYKYSYILYVTIVTLIRTEYFEFDGIFKNWIFRYIVAIYSC